MLLKCEQALSLTPDTYASTLEELERSLVGLLAPQSLHPQDAGNVLLALERSFQDGIAELEQAGHQVEGLSIYAFVHRLQHLEKKQITSKL